MNVGLFILLIYFQPSGFMVIGKALPTRSFPEGVNISPSPSFLPLCSFFFSFLCVLFSNSIFSPKHHSAFLGRWNAVSLREPKKKKKNVEHKVQHQHQSFKNFTQDMSVPCSFFLVSHFHPCSGLYSDASLSLPCSQLLWASGGQLWPIYNS